MEMLGQYKNGNYIVTIYDNGTKIRETIDPLATAFIPEFAENIDLKITDRCDIGCAYCHEDCKSNGVNSDILNEEFINTLHPYQELSIGGGNIFEYPNLIPFLKKVKDLHIISNITLNYNHFYQHKDEVKQMVEEKLVYGIGVSAANDIYKMDMNLLRSNPNIVIHVINGLVATEDILTLADNNLKVLVLGYKDYRRGHSYINTVKNAEVNRFAIDFNSDILRKQMASMLERFKVISFDNLAIEQLGIRKMIGENKWKQIYMGDDGNYTFYIDAVDRKFGLNSTAEKYYVLMDSVDQMFSYLKAQRHKAPF